jgi:FtsX-like permease family
VDVLRVAWYRLAVTVRRRWGGYLGLVLIVGLTGGAALGAAAAARRTEASYPVFLASTNPSDLTVQYAGNYYAGMPPFAGAVARLPDVRRAESAVEPVADVLGRDGAPTPASLAASISLAAVASVNGLYFTQDRVAVVAGRMADPASPDEVMMNARAASLLRLRVGDVIPIGFYTNEQAASPGYGTARVRPVIRIEARITGLVEFNTALVQDDTDSPQGDLLFTPALTPALLAAGTNGGITWYGLRLDGGAASVPAVEREIKARVGGGGASFQVPSVDEARVQSSIEPDWIALAAFAVIALAVTLLVGGQAITRQVRAGDGDRAVFRAVGAGPAMVAADCLLGTLGAVAAGSLLAVAVAVALSPVAPVGPVRPVYPDPGVGFDWTVLGTGFLVLVCGLGLVAVIAATRAAATRRSRQAAASARHSVAGRLAAASGLPAAAVIGFQFAFGGTGPARRAVPARSALSAAVVAVVIAVATLTFGASLSALVSQPALYGWNWSFALASAQGPEAVPQQQVDSGLHAASGVAAWATVSYATADLGGQAVPVLFGTPGAAVAPPMLYGHPVTGKNQVVLGPGTLAALHQRVGGTVPFTLAGPNLRIQAPLTIVGTATMPTVGLADVLHTSMGTGALASAQLLGPLATACAVPAMTFVRLRPGVSATAGLTLMRSVTAGINKQVAAVPASNPCSGVTLGVLTAQRPAQIADYAALRAAPGLLAVGLAAGAVAALLLTLFASVRRRRHDLAVLKAIGFTRRQLAATVAWQATMAAIVGSAVGIPLGVALGRWLWTAFARQIYAVPEPAVPVGWLLLLPPCALILVNLVAAAPGRAAARTPAVLALRAE